MQQLNFFAYLFPEKYLQRTRNSKQAEDHVIILSQYHSITGSHPYKLNGQTLLQTLVDITTTMHEHSIGAYCIYITKQGVFQSPPYLNNYMIFCKGSTLKATIRIMDSKMASTKWKETDTPTEK